LFPGANPIGQRIRAQDLKDRVFTIVGVVPEEHQLGPERSQASLYYPLTSTHPYWIGFVVRTTVPPDSIVRSVEASLAQIAPESVAESKRPFSGGLGIHVVDDAFRKITAARRFNATLMSGFALFALFIGAAGIYAVMASIVAQQTKEIGVRVALGATTSDLRRSVLARAGRHVIIGLGIGLPAAWFISRGFASLFFQVKPTDASIYLIVAFTIGIVALLAAIVPARRAANVDPVISLRTS
jgi:ABC-type antimicrobial peptide transport system permease subunit